MTSLYNCRHSGDQYRITKFTGDLEVESSYLCDTEACECPAGHRPRCRHREMLPKFIARDHVGDEWFFDYDRGGWVQGMVEAEAAPQALPLQPDPEPTPLPPLPSGITMIPLSAGPEAIYNTIADAVGEPRAPKASPIIRRRI